MYVSKIFRFIFYKTSHKETAEDLTSQTFIKALKNVGKFDDTKGTLQSWLFRIARNTVIDYYRTKKNLVDIDDVWGLGTTQRMGHTTQNDQFPFRTRDTKKTITFKDNTLSLKCPESVLSTEDDLRKIKDYVTKLTSRQREIVLLRVWDNLSYKEIAEVVGESEANCKMIFSRVVKKMRHELNPIIAMLLLITLK